MFSTYLQSLIKDSDVTIVTDNAKSHAETPGTCNRGRTQRTHSASATCLQTTRKIARSSTRSGFVRRTHSESHIMISSRWASEPAAVKTMTEEKHGLSVPRRHAHVPSPSPSLLQNVKKPVRSTDRKWNQAPLSLKDNSGDASNNRNLSRRIECRHVVKPVHRGSFENMSAADIISITFDGGGLDPIDMDNNKSIVLV